MTFEKWWNDNGAFCSEFATYEDERVAKAAWDAALLSVQSERTAEKLLRELWEWKESPRTKGWFQNAWIHGMRVSEDEIQEIDSMTKRVREFLERRDEVSR